MSTPACPACGSKFSHDKAKLLCKICGLPDEIRDMGPQVVARWKRKSGYAKKVGPGRSFGKSRNKHGRRGVKA